MDAYNPTDAGRAMARFVDDLSNWYVRRSRRRFWKSESDADKQQAYETLYVALTTVARLLAPFTPFVAEEIYRNLVAGGFRRARICPPRRLAGRAPRTCRRKTDRRDPPDDAPLIDGRVQPAPRLPSKSVSPLRRSWSKPANQRKQQSSAARRATG